jgi:UTP--glucose-1-phosphate uridylyltransferase
MKVKKAIIPAAGLGTRFLPATKAQPKEMLPIVDKPTIQYIVEEAVNAGIEDIIIVTGRNKRSIEDHFDKSVELELYLEEKNQQERLNQVREISDIANIHYIRQKEPNGLGHAVLVAKSFIGNEPFAVLLGDDIVVSKKPCLAQMVEVFQTYEKSILGVQRVEAKNINKYGIIDGDLIADRLYRVKDMVEKPNQREAPSDIAILGRYILMPEIFDYLENQEKGAGGEIQLTDALRRLSKDQEMYADDFIGKRYDAGSKQGYLQATVEFALRREDLREEFLEYLKALSKSPESFTHFD